MMTTKTRCGGDGEAVPAAGLPQAEARQLSVGDVFQNGTSQNGTLDLARALHTRRALVNALEHGFALIDALGLPPLALDVIDGAIAALDAIDAPGEDLEDDDPLEKVGDDELDLGWAANVSQLALGPNTADGDATAPERHGKGFVRCGCDDHEDGADAEETYEDPFWIRGEPMIVGSAVHV